MSDWINAEVCSDIDKSNSIHSLFRVRTCSSPFTLLFRSPCKMKARVSKSEGHTMPAQTNQRLCTNLKNSPFFLCDALYLFLCFFGHTFMQKSFKPEKYAWAKKITFRKSNESLHKLITLCKVSAQNCLCSTDRVFFLSI